MATITFVNTNLGVLNGLTFNPGLEDVLDPAAAPVFDGVAGTFTLTNSTGGPFNGFQFQLVGAGFNATGTAGTITGINIYAPDGVTLIATVTGPFGNSSLDDFYDDRLIDPADGVLVALENLLGGTDTTTGSSIADHVTGFGGDDDIVIGSGGNDLLRVGYGYFQVHGAEQDGSGGDAETDTLEIVAKTGEYVNTQLELVTDIDALRFAVVDPGAPVVDSTEFYTNVNVSQIGAGLLSPTLAVEGASGVPLSYYTIGIDTDSVPTNLTPVNLDLSGWTFTNWDDNRGRVDIETNYNAVVNDSIVGTAVRDEISTYAGDDVLRGGGGGDYLDGGLGNDTFIYGANEAVENEYANGGYDDGLGAIDRALIQGDNNFTEGSIYNIEQIIFQAAATLSLSQWSVDTGGDYDPNPVTFIGDGNANTLAFVMQKDEGAGYAPAIDLSEYLFQSWTAGQDVISIRGTNMKDVISGSTQNDVIAGGRGSDDLQGNEGGDAFLFDFALGKGVDHIADFNRKEGDMIQLDDAIFDELKDGKLKKKAFTIGDEADDKNDRIIYDKDSGVLRYDDDGSGKHDADVIAVLDNFAKLKAADIFVV